MFTLKIVQSIPTNSIYNKNKNSINKRNRYMITWKSISHFNKFFLVLEIISLIWKKNKLIIIKKTKNQKLKFIKKLKRKISKSLVRKNLNKSNPKQKRRKLTLQKWLSNTNLKILSLLIRINTNLKIIKYNNIFLISNMKLCKKRSTIILEHPKNKNMKNFYKYCTNKKCH